jgi:hypothetical protein
MITSNHQDHLDNTLTQYLAISLLSQYLKKSKMLNKHFSIVVLFDYDCIVWCVYVVLFLCYSLYGELRILLREVMYSLFKYHVV